MNPHCDFDLEGRKLISSNDTAVHAGPPISKVLFQRLQPLRRFLPDKIVAEILSHCCDLDLEHSNPIFSLYVLAYDDLPPNQVCLQKDQQLRRYSRNRQVSLWALTLTLSFMVASQSSFLSFSFSKQIWKHAFIHYNIALFSSLQFHKTLLV